MSKYINKFSILTLVFGIAIYISPNLFGDSRDISSVSRTTPTNDYKVHGYEEATSPEGVVLSDAQLKSLFNISVAGKTSGELYDEIEVDSEAVDFSEPLHNGYLVKFKLTIGKVTNTHTAKLYIEDKIPTINLANNPVTIMENDVVESYVDIFAATANDGGFEDLTNNIQVSGIPNELKPTLDTPYEITFSVTDNEGNEVSVIGHLFVNSNNHKPNIFGDEIAYTNEESSLTKNQLIDLFKINVSDEDESLNKYQSVSVNALAVDYSKPGTYPVTFEVTDSEGETTAVTYQLVITAVSPKIMTQKDTTRVNVNDPNPNFIALYGVTAEEAGIDISNLITIDDSNVNMAKPGTYNVVFNVIDNDGQQVSKTVKLTVRKSLDDYIPVWNTANTRPVISGEAELTIDQHSTINLNMILEELNIVVTDSEDSNPPMASVDLSEVDTSIVKTYDVLIKATDSGSLTATKAIKIHIRDVKPTITTEKTTVTIPTGYTGSLNSLFMPSAYEGNIDKTEDIETVGSYNFNLSGVYNIKFEVTDNEGNKASTMVELTVQDPINERPLISGSNLITVDENTNISDLKDLFNIEAIDSEDGIITGDVVITSGPIDSDKPGTYNVTFSIQDSGGAVTTFNATLIIKDILPILNVNNPIINIDLNSNLDNIITMFNATAHEGTMDLTNMIELDLTGVDSSKKGIYKGKLMIQDNDGNIDFSYVTIVVGNGANEFILSAKSIAIAPEEIKLTKQQLLDLFKAKGITMDNVDLKEYITISGNVDFKTPGKYDLVIILTYNEVTKYLPVQLIVEDKIPVISSTKDKVTIKDMDIVNISNMIEKLGLKATEISDGDLTNSIWFEQSSLNAMIDFQNNKLNSGMFPVTFSVVDEEGNMATTTKTIEVLSEESDNDDSDSDMTSQDDEPMQNSNTSENEVSDDTEQVAVTKNEDEKSKMSMMTLATTGYEVITVILVLSVLAIASVTIKVLLRKRS